MYAVRGALKKEMAARVSQIELRGAGGEPVDFRRTIASHGVADLPPNRIDEDARTLELTLALDGWVFSRIVSLQTGADGVARFSWRPPAPGRWRLQAFFRGTQTASPSSSAYLIVNVRS